MHLKFNLAVGWNKTAAESDKGMMVNPKLQVGFLTMFIFKFRETSNLMSFKYCRLATKSCYSVGLGWLDRC